MLGIRSNISNLRSKILSICLAWNMHKHKPCHKLWHKTCISINHAKHSMPTYNTYTYYMPTYIMPTNYFFLPPSVSSSCPHINGQWSSEARSRFRDSLFSGALFRRSCIEDLQILVILDPEELISMILDHTILITNNLNIGYWRSGFWKIFFSNSLERIWLIRGQEGSWSVDRDIGRFKGSKNKGIPMYRECE